MAMRIRCPKCQAVASVEMAGQIVKCPSCGQSLTVRARPVAPEGTAAPPAGAAKSAPPPAPQPSGARPTAAPPPPSRPEQPRIEQKPPVSAPPTPLIGKLRQAPRWVWGAAGGILALILAAVLFFALTGRNQPQQIAQAPPKLAAVSETIQEPAPAESAGQRPPLAEPAVQISPGQPEQTQVQQPPQPATDPVPQQAAKVPEGAAPATIQPESVRMVKKATVQLRVKLSDGSTAEGSGFFAIEPGIVLTNAHVVGMLGGNAKPPQKIDIVVNSGQADEFLLAGKVVGVDRDNDLAAVRVVGEKTRWPAPLPVEFDMTKLTELQKVYVFGFPLGSNLGKEITASDSSISSFRRDADGSLFQIQVNGGIQPGNSGGPVVDTRGVVVGVAVALISGTQINFVVPGEKVLGIVNGRVQETRVGHPYRDKEQIKLPVKIAYLDPLRRIRAVELEIWTGPAGKQRPASLKAPTTLPGDGRRQTITIAYQDGAASLDVPLPTLAVPTGQVYWIQPVFVNQANVKQWGPASSFQPAAATPLERIPAQLTPNLTAGERSLKLSSKSTFALSKGREKILEADIMNLEVLEAVESSPTGANIKLRWGKGQFLEELNGKRQVRRPVAYAAISNHVHGFQCDAKGALTSFGFVKFNMKDLRTKEEANDMASHFLTSYQFISLPMPNRVVQPLDSWDAKIHLLLGREKQKDVLDVVLKCVYEGSRKAADKTEALISLTGEITVVKSATPLIRNPSDRVGGQALFDVDGGCISKMTIALNDERNLGGIVFTRSFEADVSRTAGNTLGITIPSPKPADKVADSKQPASPVASPTKGANEFAPRNGMFHITMPEGGKSSTRTQVLKVGQLKFPVEGSASLFQDGTSYLGASLGISAKIVKTIPADTRFDFFKDAILKPRAGKVIEEKDINQDPVPGKEYEIERPNGSARMQIYTAAGWVLYAIVEGRDKQQVNSRQADAFFESFKLTDSAKEAFRGAQR